MEMINWDGIQRLKINVSGTQYEVQARSVKPMSPYIEEKIQEHKTLNTNFDPLKQPISIPGHKKLFHNIIIFFYSGIIKIPEDPDEQQALILMAREYGLRDLEKQIKESK